MLLTLAVIAACGTREAVSPVCSSALLLTVDTWRGDAFGAGGNPVVRTPNIDRFFRRSLQFSEAYSPVPATLPSHVSLLSGEWPTNHGVARNLWTVPDQVVTLPEILAPAGFETAAFVSCVVLDKSFHLDQGFDLYNFRATNRVQNDQAWRPAARTLRRSKTWWNETTGRKFLWAHVFEPHAPYEPPPLLVELYDPGYTGPATGSMDYVMDLWRDPDPPQPDAVDHVLALYYAEITGVDLVLGWFLEDIAEERDLAIILTSDHGESVGEHGLYFKHGPQVYPGDTSVPLAVRAPDVQPGLCDAMVRTIDIPATLLTLLGVEAKLPEEGRSLLDIRETGEDQPVYGIATQPWGLMEKDGYPPRRLQRVLRLGGAALVETPWAGEVRWFDRTVDPGETKPLEVPDTETARNMLDRLQQWVDHAVVTSSALEDPDLQKRLESLGYVE
jgi:arylsulfatase A-like enzyme